MKKAIFIPVLFLFIFNQMFGQSAGLSEIDSLKIVYQKTTQDTVKLNLLFEITEQYMRSNVDSAVSYRKKIEKIIGNESSEFKIRLEIFKIKESIYSNNFSKAAENIDNFKKTYFESCKIKYKLKFKYLEAVYYEFMGDYNNSLSVVESIVQKYAYLKTALIADFHLNYANQLVRTSNFLTALDQTNNAIEIYRKINDVEGLNNAYLILSNQFINLKDFDDALINVNNAIKLKYKGKGEYQKIQEHVTLGIILFNQSKFKEANEVFDYVLKESINSLYFIQAYDVAFYYKNLGDYKMGNYTKVTNNCKLALVDITTDYERFTTLYLLVISYNKLNKFQEAKYYLDQATDIKNKLNFISPSLHFEYLKASMDTENGLGNVEKAFKISKLYIDKFTKHNDSINLTTIATNLATFEVKEKEFEIKELTIKSKENKLKFDKLDNERFILVLIIIFGTIIIIIFITFLIKLSQKNEILTNHNHLIEQSKKRIEILLKELHHRTKNNLQLIISMLQIQARRKNYIDINEFISINQTRISSMAMIHQYLYLNDVSSDKISLQQYFEDLVKAIKNTYSDRKDIDLVLKSDEIYCNLNTSIALGLIINELITNSLKYAFPDSDSGQISIVIENIIDTDFKLNYTGKGFEVVKNTDCNFRLNYSDNGIGFELKNKVASSFGIDLINILVAQLHGSVQYENSNGAHYTIEFSEIDTDE